MKTLIFLIALVVAGAANAQPPEGFERVLIPLSYRGTPGAYGAVWSTDLYLYNASSEDLIRNVNILPLQTACPPIPTQDVVPSRTDTGLCQETGGGTPAQLIYLRSDVARDAVFALTVVEQLSGARVAEVPVVREAMLFNGKLRLARVRGTVAGKFRTMVRVYDPSGLEGQVKVQLWRAGFQTPAAERIVDLRPARTTPPVEPSYAEISIDSTTFANVDLIGEFIVEIFANDPSMKLWALATITDNFTNVVDVILPQ